MHFEYQIGNPSWDGGRATLTVSASGPAVVIHEVQDQPPGRYEKALPKETLADLRASADAAGLWATALRETAVPDEAFVRLRSLSGTTVQHETQLWENQFDDTPPLQALKARLDGYVREVSDGKVY